MENSVFPNHSHALSGNVYISYGFIKRMVFYRLGNHSNTERMNKRNSTISIVLPSHNLSELQDYALS